MDIPAKNRSLTRTAACGSAWARPSKASWRARSRSSGSRRGDLGGIEGLAGGMPARLTASCRRACSTRIRRIAQPPPQRSGGGPPMLGFGLADESEVRLVNQGGGLERLAGLLVRQAVARLASAARDKPAGRVVRPPRVALLDRREDGGHVIHQERLSRSIRSRHSRVCARNAIVPNFGAHIIGT